MELGLGIERMTGGIPYMRPIDLDRFNNALLFFFSSIDSGVRNEDIQQAIIKTSHFDFLTNKHLGVAKLNAESAAVIKQEAVEKN